MGIIGEDETRLLRCALFVRAHPAATERGRRRDVGGRGGHWMRSQRSKRAKRVLLEVRKFGMLAFRQRVPRVFLDMKNGEVEVRNHCKEQAMVRQGIHDTAGVTRRCVNIKIRVTCSINGPAK